MLLLLIGCPAEDSQPKETGETAETAETGETGDTDTGTAADWPQCPDASAWVGDTTWTGMLQATDDAIYCSGQDEDRTLEEELLYKARFRVVAGDWALPAEEGDHELALPVCTEAITEEAAPQVAGAGSTEVSPTSFSGTTYTYVEGEQPMAAGDGSSWTLAHTLVLVGDEGAPPEPLVLDGGEADASTGAGASFTLHREGGDPYDTDAIPFVPCGDPDWSKSTHTVEFDGGSVTLELWLGEDPIGTAPGAFVRATGTLDGTDFDEDDFYQLAYHPGHHNYQRHFAIVFDAAIGDACALRVEDVDDQDGTTTATVGLADCALGVLETRSVTGEELVVE